MSHIENGQLLFDRETLNQFDPTNKEVAEVVLTLFEKHEAPALHGLIYDLLGMMLTREGKSWHTGFDKCAEIQNR